MKKDIILCFMVVMVMFAMGGINILGRTYLFEPVKAGEEAEIYVNVKNPTEYDMDRLSVKAIFFEMNEYVVSREFNLDDLDTDGIHLSLDVPVDARRGDHLVKIVVSNDDYYDSRYVYLNVI